MAKYLNKNWISLPLIFCYTILKYIRILIFSIHCCGEHPYFIAGSLLLWQKSTSENISIVNRIPTYILHNAISQSKHNKLFNYLGGYFLAHIYIDLLLIRFEPLIEKKTYNSFLCIYFTEYWVSKRNFNFYGAKKFIRKLRFSP